MCGICGIIRFDGKPVAPELIQRMCRSFSHRGPDDEGIEIFGPSAEENGRQVTGGFGHRRLSVIDLSPAGHQPMASQDRSLLITYNGEIYNYRELREDLQKKGHQFKSSTDTEVILHLYEEEGVDAVHRLNGMFAFALWDRNRSRLWVCRDRIGIKPLVYYWDGKKFLLGSEIKAILCDDSISKKLNRSALSLYLAFSYVPAPHTMFEGICKLEPGHSILLENGRLQLRKYWDIPQQKTPVASAMSSVTENGYESALFSALSEAVKVRMIADVPLGAFLSGGIDSSIVVALMAVHSPKPIKTFSIGFKDDALYDETRYARAVAERYKTDHHEIRLSAGDLLNVFPDVLASFDEPFADSSAVPTFVVSRETRKHVTVALSGDGGDELFAGYRSYLGEYWYPYYRWVPPVIRKPLFESWVMRLPDSRNEKVPEYIRRIKKFVRGSYGSFPERILSMKEIFSHSLQKQLLREIYNPADNFPLKWVSNKLCGYETDRINLMLLSDVKDSLPGDMLTKVDWMSMKTSLEVRVPFLDHRVVEMAFQIPGSIKIRRGETKYLLKKTFKKLLPASLHHRPKSGFEIPIGRWLKMDLKFLLNQYLDEKRISQQGIFNYPIIEKLKNNYLSNRSDTSWMLWNLIVFQYWYEHYI